MATGISIHETKVQVLEIQVPAHIIDKIDKSANIRVLLVSDFGGATSQKSLTYTDVTRLTEGRS